MIPAFEFTDRTPDPEFGPAKQIFAATSENAALQAFGAAVSAEAYASVGNTFARNAERMRLADARFLEEMTLWSAVEGCPITPELEAAIDRALDSPYPFAHYLVARFIAVRGEARLAEKLPGRLAKFVELADTVGVYWAADAIGRTRAAGGAEALSQLAEAKTYAKTYGSIGMAYGFSAARGLGLLANGPDDTAIRQLVRSENVWLRAGVIEGLGERRNETAADLAGLEPMLEELRDESGSLFLEEQARYVAGKGKGKREKGKGGE